MNERLFDGEYAELKDVLAARDKRAAAQRRLIEAYAAPVISLSLNIPGPVKRFPLALTLFMCAVENIEAQLAAEGFTVLEKEETASVAGYECLFAVRAPSYELKARMMELEEAGAEARLLDIDVIDELGRKLSRADMGFSERRCFICGDFAPNCARSRRHGLDELTSYVKTTLWAMYCSKEAKRIGAAAHRALIYEVAVTPKPGLVDRRNSGAHSDMDFFTFIDSASAIAPYFEECAHIGMTACACDAETLARLRARGILAEKRMNEATGKVNTHMGAIFSLGLICAGAGIATGLGDELTPENVCENAAKLALNAASANDAGARGEAARGFQSAKAGLSELEARIDAGFCINDAAVFALIKIMAALQDANVTRRGGEEAAAFVRSRACECASLDDVRALDNVRALDDELIDAWLSPGGAADTLAAALLMHLICQKDG